MTKRILLLLMTACLALAANARKTIAEDVVIDSIHYNLYETESGQYEAKVVNGDGGYYSPHNNKSYIIPSKVTYLGVEFTVTAIGDMAFYERKNLTEISLPNTVKAIGSCAFEGSNISSIDLRSVDSIGGEAFASCTNLKTVIMPDSMRYLGGDRYEYSSSRTFYRSGITSINIPEGITNIYEETFAYCEALEKVTLPNSIPTLFDDAFGYCSSLKEVNWENLGQVFDAFRGCTSLPNKIILPPDCIVHETTFEGCTSIDTIIYTGRYSYGCIVEIDKEPPVVIYVPSKEVFDEKHEHENVTEMITWTFNGNPYPFKKELTYTGECPDVGYINNMESAGYAVEMELPSMHKDAGKWRDTTLATFTNGDTTFTARIPLIYEIKPSPLTITAVDTTCEYGEGENALKFVYDGFVAECDTALLKDSIDVSVKRDDGKHDFEVGQIDYGLDKSTLPSSVKGNYDITTVDGRLTITKAPLAVNVKKEVSYGLKNMTYSIEYDGLKYGEKEPEFVWNYSVSYKVDDMEFDVTDTSQVGEYQLLSYRKSSWEMVNYEPSVTGSCTVIKAPLTISCVPLTKLYGQDNPILEYEIRGFVNDEDESVLNIVETPTFSTAATKESPAGRYPIKFESGKVEAKNYEIEYEDGYLTIEKRDLHVSVGDYTRKYGEENPEFELSYSGFINDETEDVLSDLPVAATAATKESEVGEYEINITGGEAANYNILKEGGVLTIEKADQTLLWEQDLSNITIGSQVELTATASSGLPVEYVVDDNDFLSIYIVDEKSFLDCYDYGEIVLRAIQNGNQNFNPIRASKRVIIGDGGETSGTDVADEDAVDVYSHDGIIYIVNKPVDETVSVYTPTGVQVYDGVDSEIEAESGIYILKTCGGVWKIMVR